MSIWSRVKSHLHSFTRTARQFPLNPQLWSLENNSITLWPLPLHQQQLPSIVRQIDYRQSEYPSWIYVSKCKLTSENLSLTKRCIKDVFPVLAGPTTTTFTSRLISSASDDEDVLHDDMVDMVDLSSERCLLSRLAPPIWNEMNDRGINISGAQRYNQR